MDSLLSRHMNALKALGKDFLKGYIELVEGEKDPRNLVYIFAMDRVLLIEWEMDSETIEAFFDVTYCYFPITFRPPPDDPYGISTNSLRLALRRVLTASPHLAPHGLPLLIEKLQASGGSAKRDALETLEEALPIFGRYAALAHAQELWQAFRIEIMHATDEATAICSTRALESLLFVLYVGVEEPAKTAPDIVADMLDELEEPTKQQSKPASSILAAMVRATPGTARMALTGALDQLLGMYKEPVELSARAPILDHITTLIKAMREAYTDGGKNADHMQRDEQLRAKEEGKFTFEKPSSALSVGEVGKTESAAARRKVEGPIRDYANDGQPLDKFRDLLIATVDHSLRTITTRLAGIDLFVNMSHVGLLDAAELRHLCEAVNAHLVDPNAESVRAPALDGLRDLGQRSIVEQTTLPLLFNALPDRIDATSTERASSGSSEATKGTVRRALGALARLCDAPDFFDMLVVRLGTKLDLLAASDFPDAAMRADNIGYARGLLNTLTYVLQVKIGRKDRDTARYGATLVPRLLGIIVETALRGEKASRLRVARNRNVVVDLGSLVTLLVQSLETPKQQELAKAVYAALFDGNLKLLAQNSPTLSRVLSAEPSVRFMAMMGPSETQSMNESSPSPAPFQRDAVHAFASAIIAFRKEVPAPKPDVDVTMYVGQLIDWTLNSSSSLQEEGGAWLLASSVNKHVAEPAPEALRARLEVMWSDEIARSSSSGQDDVPSVRRRRRAIRVWLSIARGFLVKNSRQSESMVSRVLELFDGVVAGTRDSDVSVLREAARGLGGVMREDHVLCKENGSVIRLLYRQRFVTFVLPKLLAGHKTAMAAGRATKAGNETSADNAQRNVFLVAICSLLPSLPRATLLERLGDLFPLLILALDIHDDGVVQASAGKVITLAAAVGKRDLDEAILNGRAATALKDEPRRPPPRTSLDLVREHTHSILERLLAIIEGTTVGGAATSRQDASGVAPTPAAASAGPKTAALRCLATIARTVPYADLHPHRSDVLRRLAARHCGIDDPLRAVRLEAVDARDAWFVLKTGEGEDGDEVEAAGGGASAAAAAT